MQAIFWLCVGLAIFPSAAPITQGRGQHISEKQLARYVAARGLPLPPELRQPVLERIGRRERAALGWAGASLGLGLIAALIIEWITGSNALSGVLVLLPVSLGMGLGGYLGARRANSHLVSGAPRVARPRATDITDYSTFPEEVAVRLVPVTVFLALLGALTVWWMVPVRPPGGAWTPGLLTVAAVGVLLLWWVLRRSEQRMVDLSQHAHSDLELAWDDTTRADAIRGLRDLSVAIALLTTLGLLVVAGTWVTAPDVRAQGMELTLNLGVAAFVVLLVCWVALLVPWSMGRSRRNPALGLWVGRFGVS